jgi:hypothetical protein
MRGREGISAEHLQHDTFDGTRDRISVTSHVVFLVRALASVVLIAGKKVPGGAF